MDYNQETIDKIRKLMPLNMRKQLFERINHNKRGSAIISYSTITDVLRVYREGGGKRYRNRRLKVYDTAIRMLAEKGIDINKLIHNNGNETNQG